MQLFKGIKMDIKTLLSQYHTTEKDKYLPFSAYTSDKIMDRFIRPLLTCLGWNPDHVIPNKQEEKSYFLQPATGKKIIFYVASLQELHSLRLFRAYAKSDSLDESFSLSFVTTFESTYIYYQGKELVAFGVRQLEDKFDTLKSIIGKEAIESGRFAEIFNLQLVKEYDEELFRELNLLRLDLAKDLVERKSNLPILKRGTEWEMDIINEVSTRIITRFLTLRLAEDSGLMPQGTLGNIRASFDNNGNLIKARENQYVRDSLFATIIRLTSDFDVKYNGGIFLYHFPTDYISISDKMLLKLLDFTVGWRFPQETSRLIGTTYERFLGQEIVVEEKNKLEVRLESIAKTRLKRKSAGIYYTPSYIVNYIALNTLGRILNEKRKEIERAVNSLEIKKFIEIVKSTKSLHCLDPACGSGSFLIKLLTEFKLFYEEVSEKVKLIENKIRALKRKRGLTETLFHSDKEVLGMEEDLSDLQGELKDLKYPGLYALKHNIYGVDLDPKAITIAAFTLMLQVYDELKDGGKCPTLINENLKIGNSLVSGIVPGKGKDSNFFDRSELEEKFRNEIKDILLLRESEKKIDRLEQKEVERLVREKYLEIARFFPTLKDRYPNALPPELFKTLEDWVKRAEREGQEKAVDLLVNQTQLASLFLKFLLIDEAKRKTDELSSIINRGLIKYFSSEKKVLKDTELQEILNDEERVCEELRFTSEKASDISLSQPPKAFNWEIEFPEIFFNEGDCLQNIEWLLSTVNKENYQALSRFKKAVVVGKVNEELKETLKAKDSLVYLKLEIYAKIKDWWGGWRGHPDIKSEHYLLLPFIINSPAVVLKDKKRENVYLFARRINHYLLLAIEINRQKKRNQINTVFFIKEKSLRKYKIIWKIKKDRAGRTVTPPGLPSSIAGVAGDSNVSGLQPAHNYYNSLSKECQEEMLKYFSLKENSGFDVVVGNPPWGRIKQLPEKSEKTVLSGYFGSGMYKLQKGNFNLYKLFLERANIELRDTGAFSMIWPATFLGESDSVPLRTEFFENNFVKTILHFPVSTIYELFDKQLIMEATILTYEKQKQKDYEFSLKTKISTEEARKLEEVKPLKIKRSALKQLSQSYQVPVFKDMEKEWAILNKLGKYPKFGNVNNGKSVGNIGEGHLHETIDKKYMSEEQTGDLLIRGPHVRRYFVDLSPQGKQPRWVKREAFLRHKPTAKEVLERKPKLIGREMVHRDEVKKLHFTFYSGDAVLSNAVRFILLKDETYDERFLLAILNSQLLDWNFRLFSQTYHIKPYEIESLPIVRVSKDQQSPVISLVNAIIQKKKEYHAIGQDINDYIAFGNLPNTTLEEFLKSALMGFSVPSSLKTKNNNFDGLKGKIEDNDFILEYGIKRTREQIEIPEDEKNIEEVSDKYIIQWNEALRGKIKNSNACQFLCIFLQSIKRFSKAQRKTTWQKIAEVSIPQFTQELSGGYRKFKEAIKKHRDT